MTDEKQGEIGQSADRPRVLAIKIGSQRQSQSPATDEVPEGAAEESGSAELDRETPVTGNDVLPVQSAAEEPVEPYFPLPRLRPVSEDLEAEIDAALGELSIEELLASESRPGPSTSATVELNQRCVARVIKTDREFVFMSLGGQHEGIASRRQFAEPPAPGTQLEVVPVRYLADDGLYEVVVPGASVDVQDWSDLSEGVVVEARVTGHNKGGLECEVNKIRGFIPVSQVAMFRVENLEPYVGQALQCVVTEANPDRGNLVLSHRAVLEREKQESRERLLSELQIGQVREGVVRRLQDFGAFVDIGGIDGLIHISQLSWDRIQHPREVLEEGQKVRVRVEKIDPATGKIGLSYRDLLEDPWQDIEQRFPAGGVFEGTVTKIMDFGAFVRLAPGVEGLVHISEVAHHRVHRVSASLREGQSVQVKVLSVDPQQQRLSLSIKGALAIPTTASAAEPDDADDPTPVRSLPETRQSLQGGLNRKSGGDKFGLNW